MITTNQTTEQQTTKTQGFGLRLKTVRESLRLSRKDVADRLHLNSNIIAIIEEERLDQGPPMIFMRGYLRSYAKLLNINEEDVNRALTAMDTSETTATTIQKRQLRDADGNRTFMRWMTYLISLMLLGLVAMWWHSNHNQTGQSQAIAPIAESIQPAAEQPLATQAAATQTITPAPTTATAAPTTSATATTPAAERPANKVATNNNAPTQNDEATAEPPKPTTAKTHTTNKFDDVDLPEPGLDTNDEPTSTSTPEPTTNNTETSDTE